MTVAVYPGTFDPFTLGHHDIVWRASKLFETVIVAIAQGHHKSPLFSLEERQQIALLSLSDLKNVRIATFTGLIIDYMRAENAQVMIRGIRSGNDLDSEMQLAHMNRHLYPEVDTLFFPTNVLYSHISSTLVREIMRMKGSLKGLVADQVCTYLLK